MYQNMYQNMDADINEQLQYVYEKCELIDNWDDIKDMNYNPSYMLYAYCRFLNVDMVQHILDNNKELNYKLGLIGLCESDVGDALANAQKIIYNKIRVNLKIQDNYDGFASAYEFGNFDLIEHIIQIHDDSDDSTLYSYYNFYAYQYANTCKIDWIANKIAHRGQYFKYHIIIQGLCGACKGNHQNLFKNIETNLQNIPNLYIHPAEYNDMIRYAAEGGHVEIIEYLITKDVNQYNIIDGAIIGNQLEIIKKYIKQFSIKKHKRSYILWMNIACDHEVNYIVKYFIENYSRHVNWHNHPYLMNNDTILWLLCNGTSRDTIINSNINHDLLLELDKFNEVVYYEIDKLFISDLANIINAYVMV